MIQLTPDQKRILRTNTHKISVDYVLLSGQTGTIDNEDIISGGFSISRASSASSSLELGAVVASELNLPLYNTWNEFPSLSFEGARLTVKLSSDDDTFGDPVPFGVFYVDTVMRNSFSTISLSALGPLVKFDQVADLTGVLPRSVSSLVSWCCQQCGVTLEGVIPGVNQNLTVSYLSGYMPTVTYRDILSWAAAVTGNCVVETASGGIRFAWYTQTSETLTPENRLESSISETPRTITGVTVVTEESEYNAGTAGYHLTIEGNGLINDDNAQTAANSLSSRLSGFTYSPFYAKTLPVPYIEPLDMLTFVTVNGTSIPVTVTGTGYRAYGATDLTGVGETDTRASYSTMSGWTNGQRFSLDELVHGVTRPATEASNGLMSAADKTKLDSQKSVKLFESGTPSRAGINFSLSDYTFVIVTGKTASGGSFKTSRIVTEEGSWYLEQGTAYYTFKVDASGILASSASDGGILSVIGVKI